MGGSKNYGESCLVARVLTSCLMPPSFGYKTLFSALQMLRVTETEMLRILEIIGRVFNSRSPAEMILMMRAILDKRNVVVNIKVSVTNE